ncbi:MAG: hypothetical protein LBB24_00425 [Rickettsiales bacterium]|jgi:hypothetical protein|nr:hypothetical protein [Rickettsiales bacterium]
MVLEITREPRLEANYEGHRIYTVVCKDGPKKYVYTGELGLGADGEPVLNGDGELREDNGMLFYKGGFRNNRREGKGIEYYPDGKKCYDGDWKNNKMHGYGGYYYSDGSIIYMGEYKNGKRHGQGTYRYPNGDEYTGEWENGKRQGQGTYRHPNGGIYTGEWENDKRQGQGTYRYPNGGIYTGEWGNGKMHGQGIYRYINGDEYTGEWENGKRHGQGIYRYINGVEYTGEWENDKRQGQGTYHYPNRSGYTERPGKWWRLLWKKTISWLPWGKNNVTGLEIANNNGVIENGFNPVVEEETANSIIVTMPNAVSSPSRTANISSAREENENSRKSGTPATVKELLRIESALEDLLSEGSRGLSGKLTDAGKLDMGASGGVTGK